MVAITAGVLPKCVTPLLNRREYRVNSFALVHSSADKSARGEADIV
jgi:hypothetical protein